MILAAWRAYTNSLVSPWWADLLFFTTCGFKTLSWFTPRPSILNDLDTKNLHSTVYPQVFKILRYKLFSCHLSITSSRLQLWMLLTIWKSLCSLLGTSFDGRFYCSVVRKVCISILQLMEYARIEKFFKVPDSTVTTGIKSMVSHICGWILNLQCLRYRLQKWIWRIIVSGSVMPVELLSFEDSINEETAYKVTYNLFIRII